MNEANTTLRHRALPRSQAEHPRPLIARAPEG